MKTIAVDKTDLDSCVTDAQSEGVVLTRNGAPIALIVGVAGLDREQIELGTSARFWNLMKDRRKQKTLTRRELDAAVKQKIKKGKR